VLHILVVTRHLPTSYGIGRFETVTVELGSKGNGGKPFSQSVCSHSSLFSGALWLVEYGAHDARNPALPEREDADFAEVLLQFHLNNKRQTPPYASLHLGQNESL
jgi:hypothetical protein